MKGNREKGMALVAALMVLSVITVLSTTFLTLTYTESKQSIMEENRLKAYYIARSGADATAAWLLDPANLSSVTDVVPDAQGQENAITGSGMLDGVGFTVNVMRDLADAQEVIIECIAEYKGAQATAALTLDEASVYGGSGVFINAVYAEGNVRLTGDSYVEGGVEAGGVIDTNSNVTITGTQIENSVRSYPSWSFTDATPDANPYDIDVNNNETYIISTNGKYGTINVDNGGTLTFLLSGEDMYIVADIVNISGTMRVEGTGRLKLYVNDVIDSQPDFDISGNSENTPESLFIYAVPGSNLRLPGNAEFNGFIYGVGATVNLNGTPGFTGAIIAGEVTGVGTSTIIYESSEAPDITAEQLGLVRFSRGLWIVD